MKIKGKVQNSGKTITDVRGRDMGVEECTGKEIGGRTKLIVQAFCNLTSHKLQQKQFHLFRTPDSILYDI